MLLFFNLIYTYIFNFIFAAEESACIFIQKIYRGYRSRKEFHTNVCCKVWRKFEDLHENIVLNNHE